MILLVDDHLDSTEALTRLLKRCGHDTVAVKSGEEALDWVENTPPDLIVLDVMMPNISGLEVLEIIRQRMGLLALPVVVYTADISYETAQKARQLGANEVLVKGTVAWQQLRDVISGYMHPPDSEPA